MIYLLLAIASSACVSIFMRLSENYMKNQMGMCMANYAICSVLSYLYMDKSGGNLFGVSPSIAILLGIITGVLYLVSFSFMKYNMKYNGVVLTATFMKLGVLIPTLMAIIVFRETPGFLQIVGIAIAILAIIMIHFEKDALQQGNKKVWLLILLILGGLGDAMINIYEKVGDVSGKDGYLLMTFLVAFLLSTGLALKDIFIGKGSICKEDIFFGMLIGIPNYFSARFLLLALGSVDAVLAYPMYSVTTLVVITVAGILFFKEKISKKKAAALAMIAVALCLLNL